MLTNRTKPFAGALAAAGAITLSATPASAATEIVNQWDVEFLNATCSHRGKAVNRIETETQAKSSWAGTLQMTSACTDTWVALSYKSGLNQYSFFTQQRPTSQGAAQINFSNGHAEWTCHAGKGPNGQWTKPVAIDENHPWGTTPENAPCPPILPN